MSIFSPVQFRHVPTSHVLGPHDFPGTTDKVRPVGPTVTEDEDPKHYQSGAIASSGQSLVSVFHGENWNQPYRQEIGGDLPEFESPEHATFGHTIRHMKPR